MPNAFFNKRESAPGRGRARIRDGEVYVDPATEDAIRSGAEPLWGQFLRTWEALTAAKGRYPSRTEIDPVALGGRLLPGLFLVDVVGAPDLATPRFRYRLLGQAIIDREPTRSGDFVDEIGASADVAAIEQHYMSCLDGKVWIREASLNWSDPRGGYLRYRAMVLPLSEDGESVTHLIGLALYEF